MSQFPLTIAIVVFYDCPMLNVELLQKVKAAILAHPHDFDMDDWVQPAKTSEVIEQNESCGTVGCIAGWMVSLERSESLSDLFDKRIDGAISIAGIARDLLDPEAYVVYQDELFYVSQWPEKYRRTYRDATTDQERAQAAADYIDYFIKKNKDNSDPASPAQS